MGIKALAQAEAIGVALDPELNLIVLGEPYGTRVFVGKFGARPVGTILKGGAVELLDFLKDFPGDFRQLYQTIRRGKIRIPLEYKIDPKGFESFRQTMDSVPNRLANAILTASILICSSIAILVSMPPHITHVSVPGAVGLFFWGLHVPEAYLLDLETRRALKFYPATRISLRQLPLPWGMIPRNLLQLSCWRDDRRVVRESRRILNSAGLSKCLNSKSQTKWSEHLSRLRKSGRSCSLSSPRHVLEGHHLHRARK